MENTTKGIDLKELDSLAWKGMIAFYGDVTNAMNDMGSCLNCIRKTLNRQRKINRNIAIFAVCATVSILTTKAMAKHNKKEIEKLKKELTEVKDHLNIVDISEGE